jgi:membrane protein YqaA with SNARE-associated domain
MRQRDDAAAAGWGVLEATVFFLVPDVFLTWVAIRRGTQAALRATAFAVAGAVVGGVLAYCWGALSPDSAAAVMASLPGIDEPMVERVAHEVEAKGSAALLDGPGRAQPYKLYAVAAGEQGANLLALVLWTVPGRAVRFVLSSAIAAAAAAVGKRFVRSSLVIAAWALVWTGVYAVLWS